ncbi:hypothetical protein ACFXAE_15400 [Streptomyces sp. NPDC059454]|uniref:restriction system modified-DNA reader domain-containing protein n=1 Tax=Streptomyces sp. NPDC059454 TaxID=3346836 RepID=UPI00368BF237
MTRTIRIDDEVFAALQALSEPFVDTPNSALRRLLGLDLPASGSTPVEQEIDDQGEEGFPQHGLADFLKDGRLKAGQRLVWNRRNLQREYRAEVLGNGNLRVEGLRVFGTPSRAATVIAGNQQNGKSVWCTEDGVRLKDL